MNGTIGTNANDRVTLTAIHHIGSVIAREIYADIDLPPTAGDGILKKLVATDGPYIGTIDASIIQFIGETSQFSCVGDMVATITLEANLAEPLIITGGDFHEDSVLYQAAKQLI